MKDSNVHRFDAPRLRVNGRRPADAPTSGEPAARAPRTTTRLASVLALWLMAAFTARCLAGSVYVDAAAVSDANNGTSWANAYTDLQSALGAAVSGDTLLVAAGTYKPCLTGDVSAYFRLKSGVTLEGGYPSGGGPRDPAANETVLSGNLGGGAYSCNILVAPGVVDAVLDGFTVRDGYCAGNTYPDGELSSGAALYIEACAPTIRNVRFVHNWAGACGGAVFMTNPEGTVRPTFTNVTFADNQAHGDGGALYTETSSVQPTLDHVEFTGNSADANGGAAHLVGCTMSHVTLRGNQAHHYGGAVFLKGRFVSSALTDVAFIDNEAGETGGGLFVHDTTYALSRVTFSGNRSKFGGGMVSQWCTGSMENVTFAGNQASQSGGALYIDSTPDNVTLGHLTFANNAAGGQGGAIAYVCDEPGRRVYLRNSILWGNTPNQGYTDARLVIGNCVVQGGTTGFGFNRPHVRIIARNALDSTRLAPRARAGARWRRLWLTRWLRRPKEVGSNN